MLASFSGPLMEIIEKQLELSRERISFLLSMGSIYLNDKRCLENMQVDSGSYIRVHQNPRRFPVKNFKWPEQKIFENQNIIVINKPSGLPVPATVDNIQENLAHLIAAKTEQEIFVTHRLDMGTSGLLIFAKNKGTQTEINKQLQENKIQKKYRALVHGTSVPLGDWTHFMEPSPRAPKKVSREPQPGWAHCHLKVLSQNAVSPEFSEVTIELITGRTHQIRAQLSSEGFPIVGDQAYGSSIQLADHEKIFLQAFSLEFSLSEIEKKSFFLSDAPWANDPLLQKKLP